MTTTLQNAKGSDREITPETFNTNSMAVKLHHSFKAESFYLRLMRPLSTMVFLAFLLVSSGAMGATYYSITDNGNWNDSGTWSTVSHVSAVNTGTFPQAGDIAIIENHVIRITADATCLSLTINGSGQIQHRNPGTYTLNVTGDLTMDGTSQIVPQGTGTNRVVSIGGNFNVLSTANDARIGGLTVNINGAGPHTIAGTLTFNSNTGVKTFTGSVTNSGTWTSTAITTTGNLVFRNGITNTGTFTAGGATFNTNDQSLDGSSGISFANTVTVTGITLTNNNTGTVTMSNSAAGTLAGTGTFNQGTGSTLNYAGSSITVASFNPSGNGNTVNFNRSGNQTIPIPSASFWNLTVSGTSGTKSLSSPISVSGDLSIQGASILDVTGSNHAISLDGNWSNTSTAGDPFVQRAGTVTLNGSGQQTLSAETFSGLVLNNASGFTGSANLTTTNALTMSVGNINMGVNTLTLGASGSTGTFNYTSGTIIGKFQRGINNGSTAVFDFPVGTAINKNTASIDLNTGTTAGLITIEYISANPGSSGIPVTDATTVVGGIFTDGYWSISSTSNSTGYDLYLDGTGMNSYTIRPRTRVLYRANSGSNWTAPGNHTDGTPQIVQRSALTTAAMTGEFGLGDVESYTWYVFQDGNWADPTTWTLDASATPIFNNPGNRIPGTNDYVIIRSGKSVTVQAITNNILIASIEVKGNLYLGTSTGHNFQIIDGDGQIHIHGNAGLENFPAGVTNGATGFGDPDNGGTLVVGGTGNISLNVNRSFRHVLINRTNNSDIAILASNYTLGGNFTVRNGVFQFGDGTTTARSMMVEGNVLVENDGGLRIGTIFTANANATHVFAINSNFTSDGTSFFTNRSDFATTADRYNPAHPYYTSDDNTGRVEVLFTSSTKDQVVNCNNLTYFSRLVTNKGVDASYALLLQTTDSANFRLLGPANYNVDADVAAPANNLNAFSLIRGTVKLDNNIIVPVLNTVTNYSIPSDSRLWIDGGYVRKPTGTAIVPYGVIEISAGKLISDVGSGITTRGTGKLKVDGGEVVIQAFRTSVQGVSAQGTFEQNGGVVRVTGGGSVSADYALFSLTYPGTVFIMTGGTLTIQGRNNTGNGGTRGSVFINSDPGNQNVSGGTVVFDSNTTIEYRITSRAPFYKVNMRSTITNAGNFVLTGTTSGTGGGTVVLASQALNVLDDLTLEGEETDILGRTDLKFYATTSVTNVNDVYIGGSFRIEKKAQYIACFPDWTVTPALNNYNSDANQPTDVNTTYFNQTAGTDVIETLYWGNNQYFDYDGNSTPDGDENMIELGNMVFNRTTGNELRLEAPGPGGGQRGNSSLTLDINGEIEVLSGTVDQGRLTIRLWGNTVNYDRLGTNYIGGTYPVSGGTPSTAQIRFREDDNLTITTSDNSVFGNSRFNISINRPLEFFSDVYFERMEYMRGILYIGTHQLTIDEMWNLNNDSNTSTNFFTEGANTSSILRVADAGRATAGSANQQIMVITSGKASDGGLRLKVNGNTTTNLGADVRNNLETITFPIGFDLNFDVSTWTTNTRYRPAQLKVTNFSDDGYVTVKPVSGVLQTTDLTGGEVLQHYWRISHSDFTAVPTTAWRFYYRNRNESGIADLVAGAAQEAFYVPGKVLDGGTFQRNYESSTLTKSDIDGVYDGPVDANTRIVVFNGENANAGEDDFFGFSGSVPGFALDNINCTTGQNTRFIGAPEVYYTRVFGDGAALNWTTNSNWTLGLNALYSVHDSRQAAATSYPQAGDVAIIGWVPWDDPVVARRGQPHGIAMNAAFTIAELRFTQMLDIANNPTARVYAYNFQFRPTLCINPGGVLNANIVSGEGMFWLRSTGGNQVDPSFTSIDIGDFINQDSAYMVYESTSNAFVYNNIPSVVPNILIAGNGWGANDRDFPISTNVTSNGNFELLGDVNLVLSSGGSGDILVKNNLLIFRSTANGNDSGGNGEIAYPNDASRTIEVIGDLRLINNQALVNIRTPNTTVNVSDLIVHGNILQDNTSGVGLRLSTADNEDYVRLTLKGTGNHNFTIQTGSIAALHQIILNKGANVSSGFTFNDAFTLPNINSTNQQPVEIVNGSLVLDDAAINIKVANVATGNFFLPNINNPEATSGSGGLEIRQGTLSIEGDDTGLILDGNLTINGGTLNMATGVGNGNNFIEYSSSGNAEIILTSGSLTVGSQVRRSITSSSGVLKYSQTGGTALFGYYAAPVTTRGIFEVTNSGSIFNLDIDPLAGESFTLVRQNGSTTDPSLLITPQTGSTSPTSIITIGNGSTPAAQNNFGITSDMALSRLYVASANITAKEYSLPLAVNELDITTGATFNANGFNLTINSILNNNGTYITSGTTGNNQFTIFPSDAASSIGGTGTTTFWNFTKQGIGTLTLGQSITVDYNGYLYDGVLNTANATMNLKRDLLHDATHTSDAAGPGIIFNGTQTQNLDRSGPGTSYFGVVELNNATGLVISDSEENFQIDNRLILNTGVLDIGGNLLIFPVGADISNKAGGTSVGDFNITRMIQTNSSIRDFGIRKYYPTTSGGSISFTYPVGLIAYTPVVANITDISAGYITVRPVADIPPIAEDAEMTGTCTDPEIVDADNVLHYYWIIKSSGISGFNGDMTMYYNPDDVEVTAPYSVVNYGPARLFNLSNTWDKVFTTTDFDETNQRIVYPFNNSSDATLEGIYTAGVTLENDGTTLLCGAAIPDQVPQFVTLQAVASGDVYVDGSYQGGGAPDPGTSFDLVVKPGFSLVYDVSNVRTRKVTIEAGATLEVASGTSNHNLGFVVGEGNLKLNSNTTFVLFPTGDYDAFFPDINCTMGGGLEYAGTGNYSVLSSIARIRNVVFSGSGTRTFPNNHALKICEDMELLNTIDLEIPDGNNTITVLGNIYKSDASTYANGGGASSIIMNGTAQQFIRGDFTGTDKLNNLTINNSNGLSVINSADATRGISANADVDVSGTLTFTNGRINTDSNNSLRLLQSGTLSGYSTSRYVNGPFVRQLPNNTQDYVFPVGDGARYGVLTLGDPFGGASPKDWTVRYYNNIATSYSGVNNMTPDPVSGIVRISGNEFWVVNDGSTAGGPEEGYLTLRWDATSDVSASATDRTALTVMEWSSANNYWENRGGTGHAGSTTNGTFKSAMKIGFSEKIVTLGSSIINNPLPVELISFTGKEVDDQVELKWITATELNNDYFIIEHSLNGLDFFAIGEVAGAGTTTIRQDYSFIHNKPSYLNNYYRLKQVDFDGAYEYSDVILVRINSLSDSDDFDFTMYPNPTSINKVTIRMEAIDYSKGLILDIVNLSGAIVYQRYYMPSEIYSELEINFGGGVTRGAYLVRLMKDNSYAVKKLIIR